MTHHLHEVITVWGALNFIFCAVIFWSCLCRLNSETCRLNRVIRAKYTLLLTGSAVMGGQPFLIGSIPSQADTIMSFVVFAYLALSVKKWGLGGLNDSR